MYWCVDNDYIPGPYTVIIPAGEKDVTFGIAIKDDRIHEVAETFTLIIDPLSLPNSTTSGYNATVTILDHDGE